MSDDEDDNRKKKKKGLFGRKKKKSSKDSSSKGDVSLVSRESSMDASSNDGQPRKKKKGLGKRIKRMVGGRKRSKRSGDDDSEVSYLDKDDPNYKGPRTSLDPDILAKVMEEEDPNVSARDPYGGKRHIGGPIDEIIDEEDEEENDGMSYGVAGDDDAADGFAPIGLVLLLVDPSSLRFEILQLDFETPQAAKVMDVLEQIKESVTEPSLRSLEFHAVLDRKGNQFTSNTPLMKALTNRTKGRDILVALCKGTTADKCGRLARPILGDTKVIAMLETNGYEVKGWAKGKREESELKDSHPDTFAVAERKRQLKTTAILGGVILLTFMFYQMFQYFFGKSPMTMLEDAGQNVSDVTEEIVDAIPEVA